MLKVLKELVSLAVGIVVVLLVVRFVLKLVAANPSAQFVAWLYQLTQPLLAPFTLALPTPNVVGGSVLEFTTLFALLVYVFIGYMLRIILKKI